MIKDYVYNDIDAKYERPPYVADFEVKNSDLPVDKFTIVNINLKPSNALVENLALKEVVNKIYETNENVLIMGNMNFDCKYMSNAKKEMVRIELSEFTFLINDDVATTTSTSSSLCAMDRILATGSKLIESVVPESNKTYLYYDEFDMTLDQVR